MVIERGSQYVQSAASGAGWTRQLRTAFVFIIVAAIALRIYAAVTQPFIYAERQETIPLAGTISLRPLNLPLRVANHPALPAYIVKTSATIFGRTPLGYRSLHIVLGVLTILLIASMARQWYGAPAAVWTAALLAFNEYDVGASVYATGKAPYLLFLAMAIWAFSRFLLTERARFLYVVGLSVGLAFESNERAVLILPVFFITLLLGPHRHWLLRWPPYVACALFLVVISPDILWNVLTPKPGMATYGDHFSRVGGFGFNIYPFLFFVKNTIRSAYLALTGEWLVDQSAENPSMNDLLGVVLFASVCVMTVRPRAQGGQFRLFLLVLFWFVLGTFTAIRPPSRTNLNMDPVQKDWIDVVLFPAVIFAGSLLTTTPSRWRTMLRVVAVAAMIFAVIAATLWLSYENPRDAEY